MPHTPSPQDITPARKVAEPTPSLPEDRPAHPPRPAGTSIARPIAISLLYLGGIVTGFSPIVGVILAHVWRGDSQAAEWEETHFTYLITTFWVGLLFNVLGLAGFVAAIFVAMAYSSYGTLENEPGAGFIMTLLGAVAVWGLAALWFCIRCVISLVKASSAQPISRPRTWLF